MLRSLPVGDPARLYRIGDGDDCCVQGGPQDRWGMFSYPLFERLKAETPEFEEVDGVSGRRRAPERAPPGHGVDARPAAAVRVRHRQLLLDARRRRVRRPRASTADDDTPAAPPVVVLSHHVWQGTYGGDPSVVGATLRHRRAPVHRRSASRRRASSARRFAPIRPTCGFRCSRSR